MSWLIILAATAVGAEVTIPVKTVEKRNPEVAVLSEIFSGSVGPHQTAPDGTFSLKLPECEPTTEIFAYPKSPHLCPEKLFCMNGKELVFLIDEGCSAAAAFLKGDAIGVPYASIIGSVLGNELPPRWSTSETSSMKINLGYALEENDFSSSAIVAGDLARAAVANEDIGYAWQASLTSLDSLFRSVGLEPTARDLPLLEINGSDGEYAVTDKGIEVLEALAPFGVKFTDPYTKKPILINVEGNTILGRGSDYKLPIQHPRGISNFEDYFRSISGS